MQRQHFFSTLALFVLLGSSVEAADLCVKAGGSDATAKASIVYVAGNEAGSTCWATPLRAAWGNTDRSTPATTAQRAVAGDTVYIFGGTYTDNTRATIDEIEVYVQPAAGTGTADNQRVRFIAVGAVIFVATDLAAPYLGSNAANYVTWYADISLGHSFSISSCQVLPPEVDFTCPAGSVKTIGDTGPVICGATGMRLEGLTLTSVRDPAEDNYNAIKGLNCDDGLIQNNTITGYGLSASPTDTGHASCWQFYSTTNAIVQHNRCISSQAGMIFKDNGAVGTDGGGNIIRLNVFEDVIAALVISVASTNVTPSYFYQNTLNSFGAIINVKVDASATPGNYVVNNSAYNGHLSGGGGAVYMGGNGGNFIYNNIIQDSAAAIYSEGLGLYATSIADHQHNDYNDINTFYIDEGGPGAANFAAWLSGTTGQDDVAPASIDTDPLYADPISDDFRLCTAAGVPVAGCAGASPAVNLGVDILDLDEDMSTTDNINAGAYLTGDEVIGLTTEAPPDPPDPPAPGPIRLRRVGV